MSNHWHWASPSEGPPIKVITQPDLYWLTSTMLNGAEIDRFLSDQDTSWEEDEYAPDGERLVELGGRVCYDSFGVKQGRKRNSEYLFNIIEHAHGSVLEHATLSVLLSGVSRSLTHELVRHRAGWSYSQRSQRYVDEGDTAFVLPPDIRRPSVAYDLWLMSVSDALKAYTLLSSQMEEDISYKYPDMHKTDRRKHARQSARSVLPNCTESVIVITVNARALRHFLELRGSDGAEIEIRRLAVAWLKEAKERMPTLFADMHLGPSKDDVHTIVVEHSKV